MLLSGLNRRLEYPIAHVILAAVTVSVSEPRRNPMGTVAAGEGGALLAYWTVGASGNVE